MRRQTQLKTVIAALAQAAHGGQPAAPIAGLQILEQGFDEIARRAGGDYRPGIAAAKRAQDHVMPRLARQLGQGLAAGRGMKGGRGYHTFPAPGV